MCVTDTGAGQEQGGGSAARLLHYRALVWAKDGFGHLAVLRCARINGDASKHHVGVTSQTGDTLEIWAHSQMTHHIWIVDRISHSGAACFIFLAPALLSKCGLAAKTEFVFTVERSHAEQQVGVTPFHPSDGWRFIANPFFIILEMKVYW